MSKHTEGQWAVSQHGPTVIGPTHEQICVCGGKYRSPEEKAANARLIAAAPDLKDSATTYDALIKRAQEILTVFLTPEGNDAEAACSELLELLDGPPWREANRKYRAAIAKATGEEK